VPSTLQKLENFDIIPLFGKIPWSFPQYVPHVPVRTTVKKQMANFNFRMIHCHMQRGVTVGIDAVDVSACV